MFKLWQFLVDAGVWSRRLMSQRCSLPVAGTALLGALLLTVSPMPARAAPPDVGLLTQLSGEVSYWNASDQKTPARAQAFMKVRQGDHFKLPPGTETQVLYFAGGRQESWRGPVTFTAGEEASQIEGAQTAPGQPEVRMLPAKAAKKLAVTPLPLPRSSLLYSGAIQTMAPKIAGRAETPPVLREEKTLSREARQEIKNAQQQYESLRRQAPDNDLTPELYLLGVLAEYGQTREMEQILDQMLKKKPGDPTLQKLQGWVRSPGRM